MKPMARCVLTFLLLLALPASALAAPPAEGTITHVVQPGESLTSIAQRYGVSLAELALTNGLSARGWVYVGQTLRIPQTGGAAAASTSSASGTHVVQRGETLASIAARYGVSVIQMVQANNLRNSNWIYVGQRLTVPGPSSAGTAPQAATPPASGMHTVRPGESLTSIAARYGLNVSELALANGLSTRSWVYTGQQLVLPGAAPAAEAPANGNVHVVRAGETLATIARQHGTTVQALAQANGLANANTIYPGQRLTIPSGGESAAAASTSGSPSGPLASPDTAGTRWIDVNLSTQTVTAYAGNTPVYQALASTGLPATPTVTGEFRIYAKYRSQAMSGPGYYLPNVPHIMYFYRGYSLHGAYWHNNFGQPMSHGCVNLSLADAQWFYEWAPVGTLVKVHY